MTRSLDRHAVVVGGGVIGVGCAYFLAKRGARVTVLERDQIGKAASYGIGGCIAPVRWLAEFKPGGNVLRALGRPNRATVEETLTFDYQTSKWGSPARTELKELARDVRSVRIEARLVDHEGNLCLDARHRIWFGVTGDGTCTGSRNVEVYNGRAEIKLKRNDGMSVVSARCKSLATAFLTVH